MDVDNKYIVVICELVIRCKFSKGKSAEQFAEKMTGKKQPQIKEN